MFRKVLVVVLLLGLTSLSYGYGPVDPKGALESVVRIHCAQNEGGAWGSGVYLRYEGMFVVATANHVTRDAVSIRIEFPNGERYPASVLVADSTYDCAILAIGGNPSATPSLVAYGAEGDDYNGKFYNVGYNGDGVLRAGEGQFVGRSGPAGGKPDWVKFSSIAKPGDSGGPIFNDKGHVMAILWGSDFESIVIGVACGRLHAVLTDTKERYVKTQCPGGQCPSQGQRPQSGQRPKVGGGTPVLPWRDKIEDEIDGLKRQPKAPKGPTIAPPKVEVEIAPPPVPDPPKAEKQDVPTGIIVLFAVLSAVLGCTAGVVYAWKKTYSSN